MNIPPTDPADEETLRFRLMVLEDHLRRERKKIRDLEEQRNRLLIELADLLSKDDNAHSG